jgi:hypothetical protein
MNPYTYRRRSEVATPVPQDKGFLRSVMTAKISSLMAFAIVLLAAGSTAAITPLATVEISQGQASVVSTKMPMQRALVLGAATSTPDTTLTIDDSELEAGDPAGSLSAKPVSFDSTVGRWDYNISYKVSNLISSATLTIGTYVVTDSITASGVSETGAILKPSMTYYASLWGTDNLGNKEKLADLVIKTAKAKSGAKIPRANLCVQPQASSTATSSATGMFCLKTPDGKITYPREVCLPPMPINWSTGTPPSIRPGHVPPPPNATSTNQ